MSNIHKKHCYFFTVINTFSIYTGALSIAELGTLMPRSGGAYIYLLEGSHPAIAFLFNYIFSFVQNPAGMGINTLTCAKYLLVPFYSDGCGSPPEQQVKLLAILIICNY